MILQIIDQILAKKSKLKPQLEIITPLSTERLFYFFKQESIAFQPFWHYHPEMELTLIIEGNGTRFVGDSIEQFQSGDLVLLGANIPHHWVSTTPSQRYQRAVAVQFNANRLLALQEASSLRSLFQQARRGLLFTQPSASFINQFQQFPKEDSLRQLCLFLDLMHQLALDKHTRQLSSTASSFGQVANRHTSRTQKVIQYLLEHLDQKLTVPELASFTGLAETSFCRWFKKSTGHSFITFLQKARVEKACNYLLQTDWDISEIAYRTGFEHISSFNRTFKTLKQQTPSAYRNQQAIAS